jgi:hypothetical protein
MVRGEGQSFQPCHPAGWDKEPDPDFCEDYPLPILRYTSQTRALLSIAPQEKNNSTVRVPTGWEPPQKFIESELPPSSLLKWTAVGSGLVMRAMRFHSEVPALANR